MYIFLLYQLRGPRSNDTQEAASMPGNYIFISNTILKQQQQQQQLKLLGEMSKDWKRGRYRR